jgi:general nucleoside transport system ATP-binding protein
MFELEMRGIVKRFGTVTANADVDFAVERGEIRALVGENGAGKTTLMRILFGLYQPDEGEIKLRGDVVSFHNPRDAIAHGIGMVHQHFMLFEDLSVAENVVYGMEPRRWGLFFDRNSAEDDVSQLAEQHGLKIDPRARVGDLSVGVRQRVEILKILYRGANILILDEPTAVLTPQEGDELFNILRRLAEQGKAIIIITHKLPEVMAVAHNATVLRRGRMTGTVRIAESSPKQLAQLMIGREVLPMVERTPANLGEDVLRVENLHLAGPNLKPLLEDISLNVRSGEIVGIAGVAGNGQTELIDVIVGFRKAESGEIILQGAAVKDESIRERRNRGLAYIPEDRYKRGLAAEASVAENLALGFQRQAPILQKGLFNPTALSKWAQERVVEYDIRLADSAEAAGNLSGGNLQKVVVAREFSRQGRFILADQPTRGVDISAIEFIHQKLVERREAGDAILLISAELDEIMALSDRILVMSEGKIVADLPAGTADERELGLLMTGGDRASIHDQETGSQAEVGTDED